MCHLHVFSVLLGILSKYIGITLNLPCSTRSMVSFDTLCSAFIFASILDTSMFRPAFSGIEGLGSTRLFIAWLSVEESLMSAEPLALWNIGKKVSQILLQTKLSYRTSWRVAYCVLSLSRSHRSHIMAFHTLIRRQL